MPFEINLTYPVTTPIRQVTKPEYLFVVLKSKCKNFEHELRRAELSIKRYDSIDPELSYIAVHVRDSVYQKTAAALNLEAENRKYGFTMEYKACNKDEYYPFSQRQKHQMIEHLAASEIDLPKYVFGATCSYKENQILVDYFPLHDASKEDIWKLWGKGQFLKVFITWFVFAKTDQLLPIFLLGSYFGEKVGLYFAWTTFYTGFLAYLSIPSIVLSVFQLSTMTFDHPLILLYSLVVSLWITIMNQMWKRRENSLIRLWNMHDFRAKSTERKNYRHELDIDERTGEVVKLSFIRSSIRKVFFSFPMIIFGLGLVAAAFIGFRVWDGINSSFKNTILVGAINGISIFVLNAVYTFVARKLTDLENYRYEDQWENSFIIKIFGFQFVNCYISLFAIAFYDGSFNSIAYSLGAIFLVKQFLTYITKIVLPYILNIIKVRITDKKINALENDRAVKVNRDLEMEYSRNASMETITNYCEMIIQLGYISMFSSALPICVVFALLRNMLLIKGWFRVTVGEIFSSLNACRRPVAAGVKGIGTWMGILEVLVCLIPSSWQLYRRW
eukprot:TRINITY_DN12759_c0_g1_i11.p1 TRINITY_DN12759_c0_g1~~TRINITY_DN12759_c0_g1_i11.p1  ORF type:complete len:558 (-),score=130.20 TRINITY_DN12759_c0_g1_i11:268-1941(-)